MYRAQMCCAEIHRVETNCVAMIPDFSVFVIISQQKKKRKYWYWARDLNNQDRNETWDHELRDRDVYSVSEMRPLIGLKTKTSRSRAHPWYRLTLFYLLYIIYRPTIYRPFRPASANGTAHQLSTWSVLPFTVSLNSVNIEVYITPWLYKLQNIIKVDGNFS